MISNNLKCSIHRTLQCVYADKNRELLHNYAFVFGVPFFAFTRVVSAHGVKNEVYTCVMRIGLMDQ